VDAGAPATAVEAAAGRWIPRGRHRGLSGRGRAELEVRRTSERRFVIRSRGALPPATDALALVVRFGSGVRTPYRPFDDYGSPPAHTMRYERGTYALRVASSGPGCRGG